MSKPIASHSGGIELRVDALEKKRRIWDQVYFVATAPDAATSEGQIIYVQDGAAGLPILAFSDGSDWLRSDTRAVISET